MKTQLNDEIRQFIVQQLACFDSPSQVAKQVKEEFDVDIQRGHVNSYDCTKRQGQGVAKKWKDLFLATRQKFLDDTASIPIANQAYRLKQLNALLDETMKRGNTVAAANLIEQASKEVGGIFTNKQQIDHSSKDGSMTPPAPVDATLVKALVDKLID